MAMRSYSTLLSYYACLANSVVTKPHNGEVTYVQQHQPYVQGAAL